MSATKRSIVIADYLSSSTPGKSYTVLLNIEYQKKDVIAWLSCNCPAWCRGRDQAGKQAWERTCKHTDAACWDYRDKINRERIIQLNGLTWVEVRNSTYSGLRTVGNSAKPPKPPIPVMDVIEWRQKEQYGNQGTDEAKPTRQQLAAKKAWDTIRAKKAEAATRDLETPDDGQGQPLR